MPVARLVMGEDDFRPPFLSEIEEQLETWQALLQLSQAAVLDLSLERNGRALERASFMARGIETAIEWATLESHDLRWSLGRRGIERSAEVAAKEQATRELEQTLSRESRGLPGAHLAEAVLAFAITSAELIQTIKRQASDAVAELDSNPLGPKDPSEHRKAASWAEEMSIVGDAQRRVNNTLKELPNARRMGIQAIPVLCDVDPIPVLRIRHESPVEIIVALVGGAGGLVAILDKLLDIEIKFKTRDERERAERARLARALAEDEQATQATQSLNADLSPLSPELPLRGITVYDNLDQAVQDAK